MHLLLPVVGRRLPLSRLNGCAQGAQICQHLHSLPVARIQPDRLQHQRDASVTIQRSRPQTLLSHRNAEISEGCPERNIFRFLIQSGHQNFTRAVEVLQQNP